MQVELRKKEQLLERQSEQLSVSQRVIAEQEEELAEVTKELEETERENTRLRESMEKMLEETDNNRQILIKYLRVIFHRRTKFFCISYFPSDVLNWRMYFFSFQCSSTVNRFFSTMRVPHFSCFCWQSLEIQFQNIKTIQKRPSQTLSSFVWFNPSLLHHVIGSVLPKTLWFQLKSS